MQNRQEQLHNELLVIKCQQGDSKAFGDLVLKWQERLWRYAFKVTGSETAAWNIVQETWCSVIKGLGKLKDASVLSNPAFLKVTIPFIPKRKPYSIAFFACSSFPVKL